MPSILFVCTANICRSPLAEALMKHKLAQSGLGQDWRVESAGTWASEGSLASRNSIVVLKSLFGYELTGHASRSVSGEMLQQFDLILTMEKGHKEALRVEFPEAAARTYLLSEMAGLAYDIEDPYGGSIPDYEETAREIDHILTSGFEKIIRLAGGSLPPGQDPGDA